jgi:hypothetical protein
VDGGANAVFGPMAMILSATTDTFWCKVTILNTKNIPES